MSRTTYRDSAHQAPPGDGVLLVDAEHDGLGEAVGLLQKFAQEAGDGQRAGVQCHRRLEVLGQVFLVGNGATAAVQVACRRPVPTAGDPGRRRWPRRPGRWRCAGSGAAVCRPSACKASAGAAIGHRGGALRRSTKRASSSAGAGNSPPHDKFANGVRFVRGDSPCCRRRQARTRSPCSPGASRQPVKPAASGWRCGHATQPALTLNRHACSSGSV